MKRPNVNSRRPHRLHYIPPPCENSFVSQSSWHSLQLRRSPRSSPAESPRRRPPNTNIQEKEARKFSPQRAKARRLASPAKHSHSKEGNRSHYQLSPSGATAAASASPAKSWFAKLANPSPAARRGHASQTHAEPMGTPAPGEDQAWFGSIPRPRFIAEGSHWWSDQERKYMTESRRARGCRNEKKAVKERVYASLSSIDRPAASEAQASLDSSSRSDAFGGPICAAVSACSVSPAHFQNHQMHCWRHRVIVAGRYAFVPPRQ